MTFSENIYLAIPGLHPTVRLEEESMQFPSNEPTKFFLRGRIPRVFRPHLSDAQMPASSGRPRSDSFMEVRMLFVAGFCALAVFLAIPALLWASDWEGDNLPDDWKVQYGLSTNVYDPADLVGWWQMEPTTNNTVVDRWTNGINGTMTNFAPSPYVPGLFSNALAFTQRRRRFSNQ
jgi:hypothetical protein